MFRRKFKQKLQNVLKIVAAIAVGCLIVFAVALDVKNCEESGGSYEYDYFHEEFYCEY